MQNTYIDSIRHRVKKIRFLRDFYSKHFKKFDGKTRIYLTLQCNLRCPYCVNNVFDRKESKTSEFVLADSTTWINAINRENRDVIFTGGEPTLHPEFIEIINAVKSSIEVWVYTNFKWDEFFLEKYIRTAKRNPIFYGSYHPASGSPKDFIKVIKTLQKYNKFRGTLHAVNSKKHESFLKKAVSSIESENIEINLDGDQFELFHMVCQRVRKRVMCTKRIILVAPDGYRYQCVSKMVRRKNSLENIFTAGLGSEQVKAICNDYGYCAPCDGLGAAKFKVLSI